jgi:hypothetical protein
MRTRRAILAVLCLVMSATVARAGTVDTKPPSAAFQTRDETVEANLYPAYQDLVGGTASDDASGVASVTITFTAALTNAVTTATADLGCTDASMRACTWRAIPPLMPGEYAATASAIDRAGNRQTSSARILIVVI